MRTRRERYRSPPPAIKPMKRTERKNDVEKKDELEKNLSEIYQNVKSFPSYSSKISDFLRRNATSSLFRQVRHKFPRRRIKAYFPFQMMMSDTINYRSYGMPDNRNYKYIMVLIDVFSKQAWARPMKRMTDIDATVAMESMLNAVPDLPATLITDLGTEYYNRKMSSLFGRLGIKHYSIRGPHKASVAERFIKTLKSRLERYFWQKRTHNWIDVLDQFISNYNSTYHRSIKMAPIQVTEENRAEVFRTLYPKDKDPTPPRLHKGDRVRLLKQKGLYEKGYTRAWSTSIYIITKAFSDSGVDYYEVSDLEGNKLPRRKYYWELNLVTKNDS